MKNTVNRYVPLIYNTLIDASKDINLKPGMIIQTLGKNSINDSYGSTYKVYKNDGSFSVKSAFPLENDMCAVEIASSNATDDIKNLKLNISNLSNNLEDLKSEKTKQETLKNTMDAISEKFKENTVSDIITALDVAGVEIYQLFNGEKAIKVSSIYGDKILERPPVKPEFTTREEVLEIVKDYVENKEPEIPPEIEPPVETELTLNILETIDFLTTSYVDEQKDGIAQEISDILNNVEEDEKLFIELVETVLYMFEDDDPDINVVLFILSDIQSFYLGYGRASEDNWLPDDYVEENIGENTEENNEEENTENNENTDIGVVTLYNADDDSTITFEDDTDFSDSSVVNSIGIIIDMNEYKDVATIMIPEYLYPWVLPHVFSLFNEEEEEFKEYKLNDFVSFTYEYGNISISVDRRVKPTVYYYK